MKTLDRLYARGFKSIGAMGLAHLSLSDLNILIGANGAGKSNFLGLFRLLNQISQGNLQDYVTKSGGPDALIRFGRKRTEFIEVELGFADDRIYSCVLSPTEDDRLFFSDERAGQPENHQSSAISGDLLRLSETYYQRSPTGDWRQSSGHGHIESMLLDEAHADATAIVKPIRDHMRSWKVYHFNDTSEDAPVRGTCKVDDNRSLRSNGANVAALLLLLKEKHPAHYAHIINSVQMVFPFFGEFTLAPLERNPDTIKLEWLEKGSDAYLDASAFSDGTLRFICLSTLLLQPNLPSVILVDEPELGLHPYAIKILAELLRGAATKTQVIVSTQSVTLVNQFEPDDLIVVERTGEESAFRRIGRADIETWLDDYGMGDLWEKNIIGGRP